MVALQIKRPIGDKTRHTDSNLLKQQIGWDCCWYLCRSRRRGEKKCQWNGLLGSRRIAICMWLWSLNQSSSTKFLSSIEVFSAYGRCLGRKDCGCRRPTDVLALIIGMEIVKERSHILSDLFFQRVGNILWCFWEVSRFSSSNRTWNHWQEWDKRER